MEAAIVEVDAPARRGGSGKRNNDKDGIRLCFRQASHDLHGVLENGPFLNGKGLYSSYI